jgi:hypothetical protein
MKQGPVVFRRNEVSSKEVRLLERVGFVPVCDGDRWSGIKQNKGIWWMPWH